MKYVDMVAAGVGITMVVKVIGGVIGWIGTLFFDFSE